MTRRLGAFRHTALTAFKVEGRASNIEMNDISDKAATRPERRDRDQSYTRHDIYPVHHPPTKAFDIKCWKSHGGFAGEMEINVQPLISRFLASAA